MLKYILRYLIVLILISPTYQFKLYAERFRIHDLKIDGEIKDVVAVDLNENGLKDVLIIHKEGFPPVEKRLISIFWQWEDNTFSTGADQSWEVDSKATILDVGEIDPSPGKEIVYLTDKGAGFYILNGNDYVTEGKTLFSTNTFTVFPAKGNIPYVNFVRDWNDDGVDEVAVFGFGQLTLYSPHSDGSFVEFSRLSIDLNTSIFTPFEYMKTDDLSAVNAMYRFPKIRIVDFNGDGKSDLITSWEDVIKVHLQNDDSAYDPEPSKTINLNVRTEADIRSKENIRIRTVVEDLDNDGYADAIVEKRKSRGITSSTSIVSVFYGKNGGYDSTASQEITSERAASVGAIIYDVNGDGKSDLIVPTVSFGLKAIIRIFITRTVVVKIKMYLMGADGRFPDKPSTEEKITLKVDFSGESDTPGLDIKGDYNGDGRPDFALGTEENVLSIFLGAKDKKEVFSGKATEKLKIYTRGEIKSSDLTGNGRSDIILYYPRSRDYKSIAKVLVNIGDWM